MTVVDVLRAGRESVERGWCQESLALNATGALVPVMSPDVEQVCADGALLRAAGGCMADPTYRQARMRLEDEAGYQPLSFWNDMAGRKREEVLVVFDRAITKAEAGG